MRCPNCEFENAPDAHFCEKCGQPFTRVCPNCFKEVPPQAKFCRHCGTSLGGPHASSFPSAASPTKKPGEIGPEAKGDVTPLSILQRSAPFALQEKMRQASGIIEGERKPVTILFTDIVDSTSHSEHIDPEEWREVVSGAHRLVSESVYRYEGTIAQLLGDGVLSFFGAPLTHEDDPLRAVHAALDIQADIANYANKISGLVPGFQIRIGINVGTVVVGNIGHDMHMEYLAIGDAVNLAARLQSAAKPGKILIAEQMLHYLHHAVDLLDLGNITIKGKNEPLHVYQVEGLLLSSLHGRSLSETDSPFVGRKVELDALLQASAAVQAGLGRVVVVIGEPGLGKSRLMAEWREASKNNLRIVESATLSYGQGLPYHLLLDMLHNLLGVSASAGEPEINQALSALVAELFGVEDIETFAYLGHLLSLQLNGQALQVVQGSDPLTLRTQYIAALRRVFLALSERQPLGLIFEDIHWADQSSVEVLQRLLPLACETALLFCFTTRSEQATPGWALVTTSRNILGAGLVELNLQPLSSAEVECLSANLLAVDELPVELQSLVLDKTEGNPLFIEEVINALVESGLLERRGRQLLTVGNLAMIDIPENLKLMVLARIDRLAEETKRTLRVAAVIGRDFLVRLLDAVLVGVGQAEPRPRLLNQLSALEATSLIQLATIRPEIGYLFRHALVQEAAYEAVLKSDRRQLHQATARALEQLYPERLNELAATLAYHFERAQDHQSSLYYLERAADSARQKYANSEAIVLYRAAIEQMVALIQAGEPGSEHLGNLYEKLGSVQLLNGQHEAARAAFRQALELTPGEQVLARSRRQRQIGNCWMLPREYGRALEAFDQAAATITAGNTQGGLNPNNADWRNEWLDLQLDRLWALYWMNDVPGMSETVQRIKPQVEAFGSASQRSIFYGRLVTLAYRRDRYVISDETLQYAHLAKQFAEQAASDSGELHNLMQSPFILGFTYMWRGDLENAEKEMLIGLEMAERTGNQEPRVLLLDYLTLTYRYMGNVERAKELLPAALQAAQDARMPPYIAIALANQAWVSLQQGDIDAAEAQAKASLALFPPTFPFLEVVAWPLVVIHLTRGEVSAAVDQARKIVHPSHLKVPDSIESRLRTAIQAFEDGNELIAEQQLQEALRLAKEKRVF